MEGETEIESFIKQFASSQISEDIYVDFSEKTKITIRPLNKTGSTTLAMLWAKVLQHPGNFPARSHLYRNQYGVKADNQLILRLDDVTITVLMRTGTLVIQGPYPLEWFIKYFRGIVEVYQSPRTHKRSLLVSEPSSTIQKTEKGKEADEDQTEKPTTNNGDKTEVGHAIRHKSPMPSSLAGELLSLRSGRVEHGPTYVYRLWKLLLAHWFSTPGTKVYIATPYLDIQRLLDITLLVVANRRHAHLETIITNQKHRNMASVFDVQTRCLKTFLSNEQVLLEYNVFNKFIFPEVPCKVKFIASIYGDHAEILITSASFHADHFIDDGSDLVIFMSMGSEEFLRRYIQPLMRKATNL